MGDLYLLLSGKCWYHITLMEELVEEILRVVPNRGARDGNEPPTSRHRRKRNKRVRNNKRRYGKGSRPQRGRRDRRLRFAWVTYGMAEIQSTGSARIRDRTSETAGTIGINAEYREPIAIGSLGTDAFRIVDCEASRIYCAPGSGAFGASLNYCLNALRRNPASFLHYVCDPQYGGPRYDKYRAETSAFLSGVICPPEDIRCSDALEALAMSTFRRLSGTGPAHTSGLNRAAEKFGLPSGSLGEMYWWSWLPPRSPWVILRDFLLDVGVHGRTHRLGLFDTDFSHSGAFLDRDVSGRHVCYVYLWGAPRNDGERAPTSGGIGMEKINFQLGPPSVTRVCAPVQSPDGWSEDGSHVGYTVNAKRIRMEGRSETPNRPPISAQSAKSASQNAETAPALTGTFAEELPCRLRIHRGPIVSLLSSDEETICREDPESIGWDITNVEYDISNYGSTGNTQPNQEISQGGQPTQSKKRRRLGNSNLDSPRTPPVRVKKEEGPFDPDRQYDNKVITGGNPPLDKATKLLCIEHESPPIQEHPRPESNEPRDSPYFEPSGEKEGDRPPPVGARDEIVLPIPHTLPMNDQPTSGNLVDLSDGARIEWGAKYPFRFTAPCYNSQTPPSAPHADGGNSIDLPPGARVEMWSNYPFRFTAPDCDAPSDATRRSDDGKCPAEPEITIAAESPMSFFLSVCKKVQIFSLEAGLREKGIPKDQFGEKEWEFVRSNMSALGLYEEEKSRYIFPSCARSQRAAYRTTLEILRSNEGGDSLSLDDMKTSHPDIWPDMHRTIMQMVDDGAPFSTYYQPNPINA